MIKDYDLEINYHEGKANVVADALSRKKEHTLKAFRVLPEDLCREIRDMGLELVEPGYKPVLASMTVALGFMDEIEEKQAEDPKLASI